MQAKKTANAKKSSAARRSNRKPKAGIMPPQRLAAIPEANYSPEQRALVEAIRSGPRGTSTQIRGPFAVMLHAPAYGQLAQQLGGYCRFGTSVPPRLSEFAILATASIWRAQYEWFAHAPMAERAGVKPQTIRALHAGRVPMSAPKDERAIYDFVKELYRTRRVRDRTYARVHAVLGDRGMVELVGILGYYVVVSMTLNVFRMPLPEGEPLPFAEPSPG
jgi:4-carboxymuconolactone decarboxylase